MILSVPGPLGPEPRNIPTTELALQFWDSRWGLEARTRGYDPTLGLLTYLTAPIAQGGLEASWNDQNAMHELRDLVVDIRPEGSHD